MLVHERKTHPPAVSRSLVLNGEWKFRLDPSGIETLNTVEFDRVIPVPAPWQAAFPELESYSGYAWYQRGFEVDPGFLQGEVLLQFGAVDYWCQVFVNGQLAGEHEGGYTPFAFPIRSLLEIGWNVLTVRVYDPAQADIRISRWSTAAVEENSVPFEARDVLHGKQEWYVNVGGIWQDVRLVALPQTWIEQVLITPQVETEMVDLRLTLGGDLSRLADRALTVTIVDGEEEVSSQTYWLETGQSQLVASAALPNPHLWSLDDPHLYQLRCSLNLGDTRHEKIERFGMRSFATRDGQFLLNGEPVYLLAVLDQDFYPDSVYTVPSEAYLRDEFRKAKELGVNTLRCHIKIPEPIYLDLADEMGLLVWAEIPSWRTMTAKGSLNEKALEIPSTLKAKVEQTFNEMTLRDFNHPSLVIRTLVNEDWGTSLPLSAADRAWLSEFYERAKQFDPSRLVVDNSPCWAAWGPSVHVKSDIDDYHFYAAIPDEAHSFTYHMRQIASRPLWTYSAHGESQRTGKEPIVLSEFGNWGLPSLAALNRSQEKNGKPPAREPHWFRVNAWNTSIYEAEMGYPSGIEERYYRYGLNSIWPTLEDFLCSSQWSQYRALKYEIEAIRREQNISGYVITELTDTYWESNGLLDFERNPKSYHGLFKNFNQADVIVPMPETVGGAYWEGSPVRVKVYLSHYSGKASQGARLSWHLQATNRRGELILSGAPRGSAGLVGTIELTMPEVQDTCSIDLELWLHDLSGNLLSSNQQTLRIYPRSASLAPQVGPLAVLEAEIEPVYAGAQVDQHRPGKDFLSDRLEHAGYQTAAQITPDVRVAVSGNPTRELLEWVRQGGRLLYFSQGSGPFFWNHQRAGAYSGSWISSFTWADPHVHRRLQPNNPLGMEAVEIMPRGTILGLPFAKAMADGDILSGMVSGWIHHPAAHTVQFRYGKGVVIMTTYELRTHLAVDPTATVMLHDLIEYLDSDRCQPTLVSNY